MLTPDLNLTWMTKEGSQFETLEKIESDILAICGLGGVFNLNTPKPRHLFARADFKRANCTIHYGYDWAGISTVSGNLTKAFLLLNNSSGICDKLSILVETSPGVVQLPALSFADILAFDQNLRLVGNSAPGRGGALEKALVKILQGIPGAENWYHNRLLKRPIIHCCALLAQALSIGIVPYTRGHSREIFHPSLSRSVEEFELLGCGMSLPSIFGKKSTLALLE